MKPAKYLFKNNVIGIAIIICMAAMFASCGIDGSDTSSAEDTAEDAAAGENTGDVENVPTTVTYLSEGQEIAALLYIPPDYAEGEKRPAIVFTRPASGVKEQTVGLYAERMSRKGFVTLAFDPGGYGESQGRPQIENPYGVIEDAKNSACYLRTRSEVDTENVFNIGICMGSAYATYATALDAGIRGVATVSPYLNPEDQYLQSMGGPSFVRMTILPMTSNARQAYFQTGEEFFIPVVPETEEEVQAQGGVDPIQAGMMTYYLPGMPGDVPNWKNQGNLYSGENLLGFSVRHVLPLLDGIPFFMAYGADAPTVDGCEAFYDAVPGPKEKHVIEGAGHFDLYYKPEYVDPIVDRIDAFFRSHMRTGS